jgi:hypothetical protein
MGVFGPKYPALLQEVVTHGERLCVLLARWESHRVPRPPLAEAWLRGRAQEVEVVFEMTLFDWAGERISVAAAAASLERYLGEVHAGAREHLGLDGELECCEDEVLLTTPADHEAETVLGGVTPAARPTVSSSDTWFDPGGILREVEGEGSADPARPAPLRGERTP